MEDMMESWSSYINLMPSTIARAIHGPRSVPVLDWLPHTEGPSVAKCNYRRSGCQVVRSVQHKFYSAYGPCMSNALNSSSPCLFCCVLLWCIQCLLLLKVLFGLLSVLDGILQTVTPFYAVAKAGVLWWAASSGRPCGGRPLLKRAFEFIKNNSNDHNLNESLASAEVFVTQIGIPREAFRLALAASSLSTAIVALGVLYWMIISLEGFFHSRPTWIQSNICVLAGCLWPLYATLISRARADAVSTYGTSGGGDKQQHQQLPQQGQSEQHERQGPAAVRWLSYWPTFAFSMVALDPFLGGWVPHYYSVKLLALAFLVMPQTDGAYLIASIALSWDSNTMKSTHERTGIYVPFTPDDGASSLSSAAESVMGEHKESVAVIPTN